MRVRGDVVRDFIVRRGVRFRIKFGVFVFFRVFVGVGVYFRG